MTGAPGLLRVGVESGEGLVARFGDTVVLVVGTDDDEAEHLLDAVPTAASGGSAARIAGDLARWVAGRPDEDPVAFGIVTPTPDGIVVFLRGDVWCEVVHGDTSMTLTGKEALTWVDRVVPEPVDRVSVGAGPARPLRPSRRADLSSGIVPGGAFVREPAGSGSPSAVPEDPPPAAAAVTPPPPAVAPRPVTPEPVAPPAAAPEPAAPQPAAAQPAKPPAKPAVTTSSAETLPQNGQAPPARRPARETSMARAPIGVLRCDDGPTIPLDRSYVVGRDPQNDPSVRAGRATPITVSDPTHLISRVHAFVSVDDGVVRVRDGATVSGTYLAEPGAAGWTPITTEPTEIPPGWHVLIGTKIFVFEPTVLPTS